MKIDFRGRLADAVRPGCFGACRVPAGNSSGRRGRGSLGRPHTDAHIPALCDVEIAAILRRAILRHELSEGRAADAVIDLLDLPLIRHGHMGLLGRILRLRENFSAYDASYVALAEQLDASLLTADAALVRAVRTHLRLPVVDASGAA